MSLPEGAEVFEYALVRVVPRVERGEAINAGVIVYAHAFRYLCARIELDESRLLALDPAVDLGAVSQRKRSPSGRPASGPSVQAFSNAESPARTSSRSAAGSSASSRDSSSSIRAHRYRKAWA